MTDLTRDEILRDIILAMAERGFTFVRAEEGDTRSDELGRQDKATADPEWIRDWTGVGLWLAAVAKRGHGFVIDIDDMDACVARGFNPGWLNGYFKVRTPGGGIHASGLHDDATNAMPNLVNVFAEPGNSKSRKILELKLNNQSCATPGMARYMVSAYAVRGATWNHC